MTAMETSSLIKLAQKGNLEAVKAFVEANPNSVKERVPESGRLPLHALLAGWPNPCPGDGAWQIVSYEIAVFLIRAYPEVLTEQDAEGNTPLHCIAKIDENYSSEQFQLVYEGAKCVSGFRNKDGQLPMQVAIEHGNHNYARTFIEQDF